MEKYLYLTINIASVFIPFLASFYPKHSFYKHWKNYIKANLIVALLFIFWDIYFTKIGIWGFNERYLIGLNFFNIPIEEVLFFFCIPYSAVFVYFALKYLVKNNPLEKYQRVVTLFLAFTLLLLGIFFWSKWYTSATFLLTSIYLWINYLKKQNLSQIYFSFSVTLIFFFIVNGILTGSCIDEPVVWYNNFENMGIRMGTIPVEDTFYGFLLISSIIQIFEFFESKNK